MSLLILTESPAFVDALKATLEANPHFQWIIIGAASLLVVFIVLACVFSAKDKAKSKKALASKQEEPVEEVVAEQVQEESVEEVVAEPVQEEPVEEAVAEPVQEEPVEEVVAEPVQEEPVEEVVAEPAQEEVAETAIVVEEPQMLVEDTPISEEPKQEAVIEEPAEKANKTPGRKPKKAAEEQEEPQSEKKARVVYGKYEIYTDGTSYFYTLKASNGELLIKSENYVSKEAVLNAIAVIKRNIEVGTISIREDKHGLYQFALVARNNRTLVLSANYSTVKRAESASNSFKRFAANSPIVEEEIVIESEREEVVPNREINKQGGKLGVVEIDGSYYYILKASNGEPLVRSNPYKSELTASAALERFKEGVRTGKFYIEKDKRDKYQFKLYSASGRLVIVGESYGSKSMAISSVHSVCSFIELATPIQAALKTE